MSAAAAKHKNNPNIGASLLTDLYEEATVETKDPQPIYVLQRDTIRSFLHEKLGLFGLRERVLAWAGIELTLVASLVTADFRGFMGLSGPVVQGGFYVFAVIVGILLASDGWKCLSIRKACTVDALTSDLGLRGSEIRPKRKDCQQEGGGYVE